MNDEIEYQILSLLKRDPHLSQRALAKHMGISLGKINYCLRALMEKGIIKAKNFYHSDNKTAYAYYLTAKGIQEKSKLTYRFLLRKLNEYEQLRDQIETIRSEYIEEQARQTNNTSSHDAH